MKAPIYEPSGKAKEYGDLAINIYTGCTHGCYYCFAPNVLHKTKEAFSTNVMPRVGIIEEVKKQLDKERITGKLIHLCFTCDPYPMGVDTTATRLIIRMIKDSGNHVQILTKNGTGALRDLDLLDANDWVGVTYCGYASSPAACPKEEPNAGWPIDRLRLLVTAKSAGINTWMSCEPVFNTESVLRIIETGEYIDRFKIGKLNYHPSIIDWARFGTAAEEHCKKHGRNYYIKDSLRNEMNRNPQEVNHE
jgi:DNA repair photolyase